MSEALYVKRGRRYVPYANEDAMSDRDRMRVGTWRMTYCYADGARRYRYDVLPDTASFIAACEIAAEAMERAITAAALPSPSQQIVPYTKAQLTLIERFRADMAAAGGFAPTYWTHATAREIAQAGIDAVRAAQGAVT